MNDLIFFENSHTYLYKGIIIPCVSDILNFAFGNTYGNIPKRVLENKAKYGSKLHELVELFLENKITIEQIESMNIDPNIKYSIRQLSEKNKEWNIVPKYIEKSGIYKNIYAGTFDIMDVNNVIYDIKSTQELKIDSGNDSELQYDKPLNLQISLYYLENNLKNDYGYCLWMPKGGIIDKVKVKCWPEYKTFKLLDDFVESRK